MKVGDYVRIRWGNGLQTISKCKNIVDIGDTQYAKNDFYIHTDISGEVIYKSMIIKSSPNIINLIEVGDYVNGVMVTEIKDGKPFKEDYNDPYYSYYFDDIYSIVTKEQFKSVEYKIC